MTSQVVVYTQRIDFKNLLEFECKSVTGFAPVIKESVEELSGFLSLMPTLDVLILDNNPSVKDYSFIKGSDIKNILILSDSAVSIEKSTTFPGNALESLIQHLKGLFVNERLISDEGYISIPIDSLIHFKLLPFDLFIKLSEGKFVKRIHANEDIDEAILLNLKSKGVTELHFERKFNREFSVLLINNMINKVQIDYKCRDAQLKATNEVFLTTKEIVQSVGLPPKVIQVCESVMERITTDVTKNKDKFSSYLSEIKTKSSLNFQFRLVELTSYIATQIIEAGDNPGKEEDIKKVVFASFFCDISLKDSSHLQYRDEASLQDVWHEDKKVILEHALKASEVVAKYKNAPEQSDEIVKQHHGSRSGIGLPTTIESDLHPLSLCLMAAQELAFNILKGPDENSKDIVAQTKAKHAGSALIPFFELFEKRV